MPMNAPQADTLRAALDPLLPRHQVTSCPWQEDGGEWIVTVWDADGCDVICDVFLVSPDAYLLRRVGLGKVVGKAKRDPRSVAAAVKRHVNRAAA